MTNNIRLEDLPSKKYNDELEKEIHYKEIDNRIESDTLSSEDEFWKTTLYVYVNNYIDTYVEKWSNSNNNKRCRDFNNILDIILKKVNKKIETKPDVSYDLIASHINSSAEIYLKPWNDECKRESKFSTHYNDIEYMKKIDDLCEDIDHIKKHISKINSDNCKAIENYITQQVRDLGEIYTTSGNKYSNILGYYNFKSFNDFNDTIKKLNIKCQEGITGASLAGDQEEVQHDSGRNASIVAVTSLSGILSSFFLLYKTTSFGSILNNLVGKKIKFGNNLSDEAYHETLEDISESSHDAGYNISYNSIADS
ncbi:PIR Superfamily Protein [Plasmodium ovale wallikeri]|uniref:PIR Superfamily Protein n=1 Tax=Plasmodium ovale wallikeri TaxID=864142 RepID=A0A1A9AET9_PLAOA|nr:PIR Superfamily Protein [Plasmodium ovale wallikeri]SBT55918.1 PIR Superfamily Protein [Plasmodium ovale wallikeri]